MDTLVLQDCELARAKEAEAMQKVMLRERDEREREKERFLAEQQREQRLREKEERLQTLECQIKDAESAKARDFRRQQQELTQAEHALDVSLRAARVHAAVWCAQRVRTYQDAAGLARAWGVWLSVVRRARGRELDALSDACLHRGVRMMQRRECSWVLQVN